MFKQEKPLIQWFIFSRNWGGKKLLNINNQAFSSQRWIFNCSGRQVLSKHSSDTVCPQKIFTPMRYKLSHWGQPSDVEAHYYNSWRLNEWVSEWMKETLGSVPSWTSVRPVLDQCWCHCWDKRRCRREGSPYVTQPGPQYWTMVDSHWSWWPLC